MVYNLIGCVAWMFLSKFLFDFSSFETLISTLVLLGVFVLIDVRKDVMRWKK